MKKITAAAIATAILLGTIGMAQELKKVRGLVTKIDTAALCVTIMPQEGTEVIIFMEDSESLSRIEVGGKYEARYWNKDGKNIGKRIRRIKEKIKEGCGE